MGLRTSRAISILLVVVITGNYGYVTEPTFYGVERHDLTLKCNPDDDGEQPVVGSYSWDVPEFSNEKKMQDMMEDGKMVLKIILPDVNESGMYICKVTTAQHTVSFTQHLIIKRQKQFHSGMFKSFKLAIPLKFCSEKGFVLKYDEVFALCGANCAVRKMDSSCSSKSSLALNLLPELPENYRFDLCINDEKCLETQIIEAMRKHMQNYRKKLITLLRASSTYLSSDADVADIVKDIKLQFNPQFLKERCGSGYLEGGADDILCSPCQPGSYGDTTLQQCMPCSDQQYQDHFAQGNCKQCQGTVSSLHDACFLDKNDIMVRRQSSPPNERQNYALALLQSRSRQPSTLRNNPYDINNDYYNINGATVNTDATSRFDNYPSSNINSLRSNGENYENFNVGNSDVYFLSNLNDVSRRSSGENNYNENTNSKFNIPQQLNTMSFPDVNSNMDLNTLFGYDQYLKEQLGDNSEPSNEPDKQNTISNFLRTIANIHNTKSNDGSSASNVQKAEERVLSLLQNQRQLSGKTLGLAARKPLSAGRGNSMMKSERLSGNLQSVGDGSEHNQHGTETDQSPLPFGSGFVSPAHENTGSNNHNEADDQSSSSNLLIPNNNQHIDELIHNYLKQDALEAAKEKTGSNSQSPQNGKSDLQQSNYASNQDNQDATNEFTHLEISPSDIEDMIDNAKGAVLRSNNNVGVQITPDTNQQKVIESLTHDKPNTAQTNLQQENNLNSDTSNVNLNSASSEDTKNHLENKQVSELAKNLGMKVLKEVAEFNQKAQKQGNKVAQLKNVEKKETKSSEAVMSTLDSIENEVVKGEDTLKTQENSIIDELNQVENKLEQSDVINNALSMYGISNGAGNNLPNQKVLDKVQNLERSMLLNQKSELEEESKMIKDLEKVKNDVQLIKQAKTGREKKAENNKYKVAINDINTAKNEMAEQDQEINRLEDDIIKELQDLEKTLSSKEGTAGLTISAPDLSKNIRQIKDAMLKSQTVNSDKQMAMSKQLDDIQNQIESVQIRETNVPPAISKQLKNVGSKFGAEGTSTGSGESPPQSPDDADNNDDDDDDDDDKDANEPSADTESDSNANDNAVSDDMEKINNAIQSIEKEILRTKTVSDNALKEVKKQKNELEKLSIAKKVVNTQDKPEDKTTAEDKPVAVLKEIEEEILDNQEAVSEKEAEVLNQLESIEEKVKNNEPAANPSGGKDNSQLESLITKMDQAMTDNMKKLEKLTEKINVESKQSEKIEAETKDVLKEVKNLEGEVESNEQEITSNESEMVDQLKNVVADVEKQQSGAGSNGDSSVAKALQVVEKENQLHTVQLKSMQKDTQSIKQIGSLIDQKSSVALAAIADVEDKIASQEKKLTDIFDEIKVMDTGKSTKKDSQRSVGARLKDEVNELKNELAENSAQLNQLANKSAEAESQVNDTETKSKELLEEVKDIEKTMAENEESEKAVLEEVDNVKKLVGKENHMKDLRKTNTDLLSKEKHLEELIEANKELLAKEETLQSMQIVDKMKTGKMSGEDKDMAEQLQDNVEQELEKEDLKKVISESQMMRTDAKTSADAASVDSSLKDLQGRVKSLVEAVEEDQNMTPEEHEAHKQDVESAEQSVNSKIKTISLKMSHLVKPEAATGNVTKDKTAVAEEAEEEEDEESLESIDESADKLLQDLKEVQSKKVEETTTTTAVKPPTILHVDVLSDKPHKAKITYHMMWLSLTSGLVSLFSIVGILCMFIYLKRTRDRWKSKTTALLNYKQSDAEQGVRGARSLLMNQSQSRSPTRDKSRSPTRNMDVSTSETSSSSNSRTGMPPSKAPPRRLRKANKGMPPVRTPEDRPLLPRANLPGKRGGRPDTSESGAPSPSRRPRRLSGGRGMGGGRSRHNSRSRRKSYSPYGIRNEWYTPRPRSKDWF